MFFEPSFLGLGGGVARLRVLSGMVFDQTAKEWAALDGAIPQQARSAQFRASAEHPTRVSGEAP